MSARRFLLCAFCLLLLADVASAARYQRTKDGKTLIWNSLRGVAQEVTWSGSRDANGYATGEGTLTWYRLEKFVNSYAGKMVHGKFEGPVIRVQGNTTLQANFEHGEKISPWLEPGSSLPPPSPSVKPAPSASATPRPTIAEESPLPSPAYEPPTPLPMLSARETPTLTPRPMPTQTPRSMPTATPTSTPTPSPTPKPTPTPSPTATPTPKPTLTPTTTPTPLPTLPPTLTPPALRSLGSPPVQRQPSRDTLEETVEGSSDQPLELPAASPSLRNALEEAPWLQAPAAPVISSTTVSPAPRQSLDARQRIVTEFRKNIETVLSDARAATQDFRPIERLDGVRALPASLSSKITFLANQGRVFRAAIGYETSRFQYLDEIEVADALVSLDEITRDLAARDAPAARKEASTFVQSYSEPTDENAKPLWRYINSAFSLCETAKNDAAEHLQRARSLESSGKKSEALQEYQQIYRIYPNPITADKIRELEK